MGVALEHVMLYILRPAFYKLQDYNMLMNTRPALYLVLATGLQESNYMYLQQLGKGPALGFWQMEPATHQSLWDNFIMRRKVLRGVLGNMAGVYGEIPSNTCLQTHLLYAAAMARVQFWTVPHRIPPHTDVLAMAQYWKAHYNTARGKGTQAEFARNYEIVLNTIGVHYDILDSKTHP